MEYRCEATSVAGFIQQLAVAYVGRGYFFFVAGEMPEKKDPKLIDEKLIAKYGCAIGKRRGPAEKPPGSQTSNTFDISSSLSCLRRTVSTLSSKRNAS